MSDADRMFAILEKAYLTELNRLDKHIMDSKREYERLSSLYHRFKRK